MKLLSVGRSSIVGLSLAAARTSARRARPLVFDGFRAELDALERTDLDERLLGASAGALQGLLAASDVTALQLALWSLDRVRRCDGELGSIIELNAEVLDEARASDARRAAGGVLGPLDGIPITLKDNIETAAPMHTTAGAVVLADHVAAADAPVAARVRAAGAVIVGKANLSELAGAVIRTPGISAVGGRTCNPYGERFTAGGSSSGSAVAVAASLCALSVGTETSGSLVAPAAYNGVVGMKPSRGLVPTDGIVPLVASQDSAGPIARCVADAAALLEVLSGGAVAPTLSSDALIGVAVGVLEADIGAQRSPYEHTADAAAMIDRINDGLRGAGALPAPAPIVTAERRKAFESGFLKTVLGGLAWDTTAYLAAAGAPVRTLSDLHAYNLRHPRARMPKGQFNVDLALLLAPDADAYRSSAAEQVEAAAAILDETFAAAGADVLASVSNCHSMLYATAGYPAVTVPLGLRANGMPTGVTFIARPGSDATLLEWAFAFESATMLRVAPPE